MTAEQWTYIAGIVFGLMSYGLVFLVGWRRLPHQNAGDDSITMKNTNEAMALATKGRLRAEKELETKQAECDEWRTKYEALRIQLKGIKYRVELILEAGDVPQIQATAERIEQ